MKTDGKPPISKWGSFKVAAIYAVFSSLWILTSDQILYFIVKDPEIMTRIQMIKGWAFIVISALIIYVLLKREIGKYLQAEAALKESEEKYRQLFNSTNDAVFVHQPSEDGSLNPFLEINDVACRIYGYSRKELLGLSPVNLILPEETEVLFDHVLKTLKNGSNVFEIRHHDKNNRVFPVEISAYLFNYKGRPTILSVVRDITERKMMEEDLRQASKLESIGTLAGGVAHEFNNILGIIVGNSELSLDTLPQDDPSYGYIKEIKTASLRAKEVIRQLLSFSRKTGAEVKALDLGEVIAESVSLIRSSIPSNIEIQVDLSEKGSVILADETQISQILINLCTNASHAMEPEGGLLEIKLRSRVLAPAVDLKYQNISPGRYAQLIVKDNGPGISPGIRDRIFDPYFTTKGIGEGTGMGLAVVHGIVKHHGGEISVESYPDQGAVFTVIFPETDEQPVKIKTAVKEQKRSAVGKTILFVDDETALVDMARIMLEKLGYIVAADTNPENALDQFKDNPDRFDLVISDMTMPQMNGIRFAEKLKEIRPDLPVIICTGHSTLIDDEKAEEIGISAYAMKPITMSEISELIEKALLKT